MCVPPHHSARIPFASNFDFIDIPSDTFPLSQRSIFIGHLCLNVRHLFRMDLLFMKALEIVVCCLLKLHSLNRKILLVVLLDSLCTLYECFKFPFNCYMLFPKHCIYVYDYSSGIVKVEWEYICRCHHKGWNGVNDNKNNTNIRQQIYRIQRK